MPQCPACGEPMPSGADTCPSCHVSVHESVFGAAPVREKKWSLTAIILVAIGVGFLGLMVCGGALSALLLPAIQQSREAARRTQCRNNLKQIGLALHNYHDAYGCFPPAYIADETGKPMHSWRVLILPFIDQSPLYAQYNFAEPWDSPNNSRLLTSMPAVYRCPSDPAAVGSTTTNYAGVAGPKSIFRGAQPVALREITDGTSNTLAVGEVKAAIPWMQPVDVDITVTPGIGAPGGFGSFHVGGAQFLFSDGSVRFLSDNINSTTLQSLYTIDGAEQPGQF